jgi:ribonuclease I
MADIMGGAGLAFYQWKKHGRCSGLSAPGYYAVARQAFESVTMPAGLFEDDPDAEGPGRGDRGGIP